MERRHFLKTGLVASAAGLGLTPVLAQSNDGSLIYMTPNTLTLAYAPELYADVSGKFEKNGVKVRLEVGRSAAQPLQLVTGNQVHIGRTAGSTYMAARAQGNTDVIAIGTIAQTSPFFLVSSAKAPIRSGKDMEGKIIGLPSFGGTAEGGLNLMLEKAGVAPTGIRRERVAYNPSTFGLIEAGRLHGFFANTSAVARMKGEKLLIHVLPVDDGLPGNVYVAREENLKTHRKGYVAFTKSIIEATRELAAMGDKDLAGAIALIGKKHAVPGIDNVEVSIDDIKTTSALWTTHGIGNVVRNDPRQWEEAKGLLEKSGAIVASTRSMFTNSIWEEASK